MEPQAPVKENRELGVDRHEGGRRYSCRPPVSAVRSVREVVIRSLSRGAVWLGMSGEDCDYGEESGLSLAALWSGRR